MVGKSEEQLTSTDSWSTVGRQITNTLTTGYRQVTDRELGRGTYFAHIPFKCLRPEPSCSKAS